jgi:hypothetical protein
MNGKVKFHKPNGPAFAVGQEWQAISEHFSCWIDSVRKFGEGKFDYIVNYHYADGTKSEKDAWGFQVRYRHVADKHIR